MAAKTFYLSTDSYNLTETSPGAEAFTTVPTGWIVSTGAGVDHSSYFQSVERAASTFGATVQPDGTLDTANLDFLQSSSPLNGTFDAGNWVIDFAVRANTNGGTQDGAAAFRLFKATGPNGSGTVTEVGGGLRQGSTVTDLLTTVTQKSSVTFNPGSITFSNEYLCVQTGWQRTGAGGMTSSDVNVRVGTGATVITTPNFTAAAATDDPMPYVCFGGYYPTQG